MCGKLFGKHLCTYTIEFGKSIGIFESSMGQFFEDKYIVFVFIHSGTIKKYLGIKSFPFLR